MTTVDIPRIGLGHASAPASPQRRLFVIGLVLLLAASGLSFRLVRIQVMEPDRYLEWGESQRLRSLTLPAERGAILDRHGVVLATSIPRPTIWADPSAVVDPRATAQALSPVLGVEVERLEYLLSRDSRFSYLGRQVDDSVAAAVLDLGLAGVFSYEEPSRFSPGGDEFARSILGRSDLDSLGISGVELQYDSILTGTPGELVFERAHSGAVIPTGEFDRTEAIPGSSIVLTIDQNLQFETERQLIDQVTATGGQNGIVLIMNNATGEILAMANVSRDADGVVRPSSENLSLTWNYEPGSIAKPFTFASVFEAGAGTTDEFINVADSMVIWDKEFTDDHPHALEYWSPVDILRESSNIGTISWANRVGADTLYDTLSDFGIGQGPILGFPNEAGGVLHDTDDWSGTSLPTIAIGQGVSTTPLQMLQAYATIANGGIRVPAQLVLGATGADGTFNPAPVEDPARVISEGTAADLTRMLTAVVEGGTGTRAGIPGYTTAGKTGTAWKPNPVDGGYEWADGRRYVASFAGFLPADDPQVTILVVIDDPVGNQETGGRAAAPLFGSLSRYALSVLSIPPTSRTAESEQADVRSKSLDEIEAERAAKAAAEAAYIARQEERQEEHQDESAPDADPAAADG